MKAGMLMGLESPSSLAERLFVRGSFYPPPPPAREFFFFFFFWAPRP